MQVIVYADREGRSPDLVEDQITYPISTRFIAAPKVNSSAATVKRTDTPGRYRVEITPDMGGDWTASLSFDGSSETSFTVNVSP